MLKVERRRLLSLSLFPRLRLSIKFNSGMFSFSDKEGVRRMVDRGFKGGWNGGRRRFSLGPPPSVLFFLESGGDSEGRMR